MASYSSEFKQAILSKVLPPQERSVREVAEEEGVHYQTIYGWLEDSYRSRFI